MGIDERDEGYRPRGQAPRRRGSYEDNEPFASRSYQRGGRDDAPRARPRSYDDAPSSRGGRRDDDPRGGRYDRGAPERDGYDRRPRPDQGGSSGRRPREDWDEDPTMRRDRRGADPYSRSGRNPRPPVRDEWETSARPRGGPRSPAPGDSGARVRRPGAAVAPRGGGLWGDEQPLGANARRNLADPRGLRRGQAQEEEEESGSPGAAIGKALLAIVLALVIGAGAAYGYYLYSTPKPPVNTGQPSGTPTGATRGHVALTSGRSQLTAVSLPGDGQRAFLLIPGATQA